MGLPSQRSLLQPPFWNQSYPLSTPSAFPPSCVIFNIPHLHIFVGLFSSSLIKCMVHKDRHCVLFKLDVQPQNPAWHISKYLLNQWWNQGQEAQPKKAQKQGGFVLFFFLCRLALIFSHLFILLNTPFGCLPTSHQDFSGAPSKDWNDLIGSACSPFLSLSLYPCFLLPSLPPSLSLCATCVFNIFNEGVTF